MGVSKLCCLAQKKSSRLKDTADLLSAFQWLAVQKASQRKYLELVMLCSDNHPYNDEQFL